MKRFSLLLLALLMVDLTTRAQAPDKFSYQAVIRDASGAVKVNEAVNIQVGILQGTISSTPIYLETQSKTTNEFGIVNLIIGESQPIPSGIDWSLGPFFLKVWVNGAEMGTSQLLTVPYALYANYANVAGNGFSGQYSDLKGRPVLWDSTWASIKDKPSFFDGQYASLTGAPSFSKVASTGNYTDLSNKPSGNNIGDVLYWNGSDWTPIPTGKPGQFLQLSMSNIPTWTGSWFALVNTSTPTSITESSVIIGGQVTTDGGEANAGRGVCWNKSYAPTLNDYYSSEGTGAGTFSISISGLTAGTTYHARAYVKNSAGTVYGNEQIFATLPSTGTISITDADGNTYRNVTIGTQVWMDENLKTTLLNDGTPIPSVTDDAAWASLTTPGYNGYYGDTVTYKATYGILYNWYVVIPTNFVQLAGMFQVTKNGPS